MRMKKEGIVERLCKYLGRQNFASEFLDYFASRMFSTSEFAYGGVGAMPMTPQKKRSVDETLSKPIMMARPPAGTENYKGKAPTTPHKSHDVPVPITTRDPLVPTTVHNRRKKDALHASKACADPLYKGMHGAPCKYEGGSDIKCPPKTVSGWWWSYEVPGKGRIYYVDCCGGTPNHGIFCNWSSEPNWCAGLGKAAAQTPPVTKYNCTLAILEADMNVKKVGSGYEVVGVDP